MLIISAKGFLKCKQNEPNFNDCVLEASNLAVPELVKGKFFFYFSFKFLN